MRVKCLAQKHNTITRLGLEPGPLDQESNALTIRPPRLPIVKDNRHYCRMRNNGRVKSTEMLLFLPFLSSVLAWTYILSLHMYFEVVSCLQKILTFCRRVKGIRISIVSLAFTEFD